MDKPILFISHSSMDGVYLRVFKDLIHEKTGGIMEIFLSSDGQSIPFGTNWVHSIERALERASVIFVAVSPHSVNSDWVYFEAGYTYSRGVKVIPIGIRGMSIASIAPPLSLLQGFDVVSYESLNNVIAIINREYDCCFAEDFQPSDFQRLTNIESASSALIQPYTEVIDFISAKLPSNIYGLDESYKLVENAVDKLTELLSRRKYLFYCVDDNTIKLSGVRIDHSADKGEQMVVLWIDPLSIGFGLPLVRELFRNLYNEPPDKFWFRVFFPENFRVLTSDFKVSSRLASMGVAIYPERGDLLRFRNMLFTLDDPEEERRMWVTATHSKSRPWLRVVGSTASEEELPVVNLIDLLLEAGVIKAGT